MVSSSRRSVTLPKERHQVVDRSDRRIPPENDVEYVWRLEDVQIYLWPYDFEVSGRLLQ